MAQLEPVSKEEWQRWKRDKVTQNFLAVTYARRQELMEEWAAGRLETEADIRRYEGRVQNMQDTILYILQDFQTVEEKPSGN